MSLKTVDALKPPLHSTPLVWCVLLPCLFFVTLASSQRIFVDDFCDKLDRRSHRVWFEAELTVVFSFTSPLAFETRQSPWRWFVLDSPAMISASYLLLRSDCFNDSSFKTTPSRDVTPRLMTSLVDSAVVVFVTRRFDQPLQSLKTLTKFPKNLINLFW